MIVNYEVISPCHGIVEKITCEESSYVHEGETLFVIRTENGLVHIAVDFSGYAKGFEVRPGDEVIPGMVLVYVQEDISGIRQETDSGWEENR